MSKIRIIIAGGRDFNNYEYLKKCVIETLFSLGQRNVVIGITPENEKECIEFISGTARGADTLGEKFAEECGYTVKRFPANWNLYGKRAGYLRNEQMAKYAIEDDNYGVLIAFWDGDSKGTEHMINIAKARGLEYHIFNY